MKLTRTWVFYISLLSFYYSVSQQNDDITINDSLNLKKEKSIPLIYTFSNVKPIQKDPALRTKILRSEIDDLIPFIFSLVIAFVSFVSITFQKPQISCILST